jgi:hypothetical protein
MVSTELRNLLACLHEKPDSEDILHHCSTLS